MEAAADGTQMARALLTEGEKKAIRGDDDVNEGSRSTQISRARKKIEQMQEDAQFLREHDWEMYEDLRDAVVGEEVKKRFERLEERVDELEKERQDDE